MRKLQKTFAIASTSLWLITSGCATRTAVVIDTSSDVVRLNKPARASISIYRAGKWVEAGKMDLPAGWYAGPGPKQEQ